MKFLKTFLKIAIALCIVGLLCLIPLYIIVFRVLPEKDPDGIFNRRYILSELSGESRVYYRDGERLLGSFFDVNHRIYVPFGEIPENIVNALVAAEDARYFDHGGFDITGFSRAMLNNVRAGRLQQGGSTLTQQTVKNIYGREERSIKAKWKELINALRMEKHFSKEEILEFYLNQFHVSGTGKGVAIAAQYFFNKDLKDLTLAECAFIAGSVKGPFNYDPFIQRNQQRRDRALERGRTRLKYVLGRMVDEEYITQEQMDSALAKPLEFNHGNFRFSLSTQLSRLEEKFETDFYQGLFEKEGISDWRKAQLQIVTTIDADYQMAAKRAVQDNISNLQVKLGGFVLPKSDLPNRAAFARAGDYLYGAVDSVNYDGKGNLSDIYLSFGQLHGHVSASDLADLGKQMNADVKTVLAPRLAKGSVLLASVKDTVKVDGAVPCLIETEPVLQGALVAIQNGEVVASQAGFHNTGFDRSFKAKRQLGSSWKPILYAAALNYHWHYLDELENEFNLFQYENDFYFPRPDHKNKGETVSILWAAVRSENIASIWLLDHLLDKLSTEEFMGVAAENGYLKREDEAFDDYRKRLRDQHGLYLNETAKQEIEFSKAQKSLYEKLLYENRPAAARALRNMFYGRNVESGKKKYQKIQREYFAEFNHNFLHYLAILKDRDLKALNPEDPLSPTALSDEEVYPNLNLSDIRRLNGMMGIPREDVDYSKAEELFYWPDFRRSVAMAAFAKFAGKIGIHGKLREVQSMPLGVNEIPLAEMTTAYQTLLTGNIYKCTDGEWNEPCLVKEIRDRDGRRIFENSVETKKVLSDTVTEQMAVMLHAVFQYGTAISQYKNLTMTSPSGENTLLYPTFGKTGTTNDYRNVAFLGAIPTFVPNKNGFALDSVIAIGSYVGFDDNRPLKSGRTRIAGSSGGLPQWAEFAKAVVKVRDENLKVDFLDISMLAKGEIPLRLGTERGEVQVNPVTGLPVYSATETVRNVPLLDVPGYTSPAQVETAAASAANSGMMTSLSMPAFAPDALPSQESSSSKAEEEEFELPADFTGDNAFVPIEPGEF
ncbi:MAG: transglycosylase domain-containing protein [Fibrobacter sp.]|nr:transglycosylase domain-containing protein [Fibrobacter sp.]MDY6368588.1 transglycosylase domain-containing protein [Fibrobacter sp.]